MSFDTDEFRMEGKKVGKKKRCPLNAIIDLLSEVDSKTLYAAIESDPLDVPPGAIANVLNRHGHEDIQHHHVRVHRAKKCSCFKP